MRDDLQKKLDEIEDLINDVEGDTDNVTRAELREFLEELASSIQVRLDGLSVDEKE